MENPIIVDGVQVATIEFEFTGEWEHRAPRLFNGDVEWVYWRTTSFSEAQQVESARMIKCPVCGEEFTSWSMSACRDHLRHEHEFQYVEGPSGCLPSAINRQIPYPYWGMYDKDSVLHAVRSAYHSPIV